jgi:hypothetical protein
MRRSSIAVCLVVLGCGSPPIVTPDAGNTFCVGQHLPPNLVQNWGFDCSGAAAPEWAAIYGKLDFPDGAGRKGSRAARLVVSDETLARFSTATPIPTEPTKTYCLSAWARGTAPHMRLTVVHDNASTLSFASPVPKDWGKIPPSPFRVRNPSGSSIQPMFEIQTSRPDSENAKVGDTLLIDDVDVWESSSGLCDETR